MEKKKHISGMLALIFLLGLMGPVSLGEHPKQVLNQARQQIMDGLNQVKASFVQQPPKEHALKAQTLITQSKIASQQQG